MSGDAQTARGLAGFLTREWGGPVAVENLSIASAGARRRNALFDAVEAGGARRPLVATIVPNEAILELPIPVEAGRRRLAEEAGLPVPHVHAVCDEARWVGGPFFVTGRVEGVSVPRQVLRRVEATPALGPVLAEQCGRALARLHAVDCEKAHPDLPRPEGGDPAAAALARATELMGELLQPSPAFALALRWLSRHRPSPPERLAVVHGDFRNGNLIVGDDGLRAVLDWEVSHVGDPMEDAGWLCMRMWRFRSDALEVGGFGTREDLRRGYGAEGGDWRADRLHWWKTMKTLSWGLGLAGQAAAHLDGSVPSIVMAASGRRVAELEYDVLMLLRRAYE